jgi:hypothetical protein
MKRNSTLKRTPLKSRGVKADVWKLFRDAKFNRDKNDEGLIRCQCSKIGLEDCRTSGSEMDLHHIKGRDEAPELYYDESNMVWLVRSCHEKVHQP